VAIRYERDDVNRRIVVTVAGRITVDDCVEAIERQAREGTWKYAVIGVADEHLPPVPEDVREIASHVERLNVIHGPRGPVAIVSANAPIYEAARMYAKVSRREQDVAIFRTIAEAESWSSLHSIPTAV
jgi:hypothetical protein